MNAQHHHHSQDNFQQTYGAIPSSRLVRPYTSNSNNDNNNNNDDESSSDDDDDFEFLRERLLLRTHSFSLPTHPDKGHRALSYALYQIDRPHMRVVHAAWMAALVSVACQFALAPLLPSLQSLLGLNKNQIWFTNIGMMVGGIPMRFVLGPLCDVYGPKCVVVWMMVLCAIPCALSGGLIVNYPSLWLMRFLLGAMDAFVPCQSWITLHFVREVSGTLLALVGGLGASGSALVQIVVGGLFEILAKRFGEEVAWRLAVLVPAIVALVVAWWVYYYTDDCPLGSWQEVQKAGWRMQRQSAVDSFRSGALNINSWLLSCQFAGSYGVDVTLCNGCVLYFHDTFHQSIAAAGAIAFGYGISAVYARALGGHISDVFGTRWSLRGRLWVHLLVMIIQGLLNIQFAKSVEDLSSTIMIMVLFSVFVQVSRMVCVVVLF